nr:uncharacterized protein LOC131752792 [Kogia breviceps]
MRKSEFWSPFGQQEPGSSHVASLGSAACMCKWHRPMGDSQSEYCVTPTRNRLLAPLGSRDQRLGSFPKRVHPSRAHSPRQGPALGQKSAQWAPVGAASRASRVSNCASWESPGAFAPFVSGVGAKGQKNVSLHEPPALQPSAWRVALGGDHAAPGPSLPSRVLTPQGAGEGAREGGGFKTIPRTAARPAAPAEDAGRTNEHSPSSGRPAGSRTHGARSHPDVNPNLREADKKEMKKPITWRESTTRLLGGKSKRPKPV